MAQEETSGNPPHERTHHDPPEPGRPRRPRKRRWGRIVLIVIVLLLVVLAILVGLAPTLLSTGPGERVAMGVVNSSIPGTAKVESLSLKWGGPQKITGLKLLDPEGQTVLTAEEASSQYSIWSAITGGQDYGRTVVRGLEGDIVYDESGQSNLNRALGSSKQKPSARQEPGMADSLAFDLEVTAPRLSIQAPDTQRVVLEDLHAAAALPSLTEPLTLDVSGTTRQGEMGGDITAKGTIRNLFDAEGRIRTDRARADLTANVRGLPTDGVGRLMGLRGTLTAALGRRIDLNLQARAAESVQTVALEAQSPNAGAEVHARIAERMLELTQPAVLRFTATPALVRELTAGSPGGEPDAPARPSPPQSDQPVARRGPHRDKPAAAGVARPPAADRTPRIILAQAPAPRNRAASPPPQDGKSGSQAQNPGASSLRLVEPVPITLTVDRLRAPVSGFQPARVSLHAALETGGPFRFTGGPGSGEVAIRGLSGNVETENLARAVQGGLNAQLAADTQPGRLNVHAEASNLFPRSTGQAEQAGENADGPGDPQPMRLDAVAELADTPTLLLDRLLSQDGRLVDMLGPVMTLQAGVETTGPERTNATLDLDSPRLQARLRAPATVSGGVLTLAEPASASATVTPQLLQALTASSSGQNTGGNSASAPTGFTLAGPATAEATIDEFELPVQPMNAAGAKAGGTLKLSALRMAGADGSDAPGPAITNTTGEFGFNGGKGVARLQIQADASVPGGTRNSRANQPQTPPSRNARNATETNAPNRNPDREPSQSRNQDQGQNQGQGRNQPLQFHARLSNLTSGGRFSAARAAANVRAHFTALPTAFVEAVAGRPGLTALVGPSMDLDAVANVKPAPEPGGPRTGDASVKLSAPHLEADAALALAEAITLQSPAHARLTLTPEGYQALMRMRGSSTGGQTSPAASRPPDRPEITPLGGNPSRRNQPSSPDPQAAEPGARNPESPSLVDSLTLAEPARLTATIQSLRVPQPFDIARTAVQANLASPKLAMTDSRTDQPATLRDLDFTLNTPGLGRQLALKLRGVVEGPIPDRGASRAGANGSTGDDDPNGDPRRGDSSADQPPAGADPASSDRARRRPRGAISRPRGDRPSSRPEGAISRPPRNPQAPSRPRGAISRAPQEPRNTPPEGAIGRNPDSRPSSSDRRRAENPGPRSDGNERNRPAPRGRESQRSTDSPENARDTGGARRTQSAPEPTPGPFAFDADLKNLLNDAGEMNLQGLTADVRSEISGLPVLWINRALGLEPSTQQRVAALLGPMIGGKINAQLSGMSGPLSVNLVASNMRMPLDARLSEGRLTLNQDLHAEFDVTPALGDMVLRNINPLLISAIRSPSPITLQVRADGFSLPTGSYDMKKISVPEATLDLGELVAENRGPISGLLGLIQKIGGLANLGNELTAFKNDLQRLRFSPLTMRVKNGVAQYDQVNVALLGPAAQIGTSGKVLWVNPQNGESYDTPHLDMRITLASGLFDSLGLKGLGEAFTIPIPMTGTTTKPEIDFGAVVPQLLQQMPDALINKVLPNAGQGVKDLLENADDPGKALENLFNGNKKKQSDGGSDGSSEQRDRGRQQNRSDRSEDRLRGLFEGLTQPRSKERENQQRGE